MWQSYLKWETKISEFFKIKSIYFLRISFGLVYLWFGLLKIFEFTPPQIELMISRAIHWIELPNFELILGFWESLIGCFFLFKPLLRFGLLLFFLQFPGTFLPLFTHPEEYFTVFPFVLTLEAKYIIKNIVYLSAALVLFSSLHEKINES